jgi:GT2 family glycosyltransferase
MSALASIIIPTFNKRSRLRFTLGAYRFQDTDEFEIVICDDGSTDGTADLLATIDTPYALRVVTGEHRGAAAARNRAVAAASGSILIFNDDDMVPAPGFVRAHIAACEQADVLARGTRWSVPIDLVAAFLDLEVTEAACEALWRTARLTSAEAWTLRSLVADEAYPYRFLQACTSNLAVRRESFDSIGGFNESFGTGWGAEDTEFGYRAQDRGYSIALVAEAVNLHLEHSLDSGKKFENGLDNFRKFRELYPQRRDVRALLFYVEHAVAFGNVVDLFDE